MSIFIAFIIGIICGVILCALSDCLYQYGQQVGRESAVSEAREAERTEEECCGGAHPLPPPRPSAHLSPSRPVRGTRQK